MSNLAVVMTGEEAQLWRALNKIVSKEKEVETGFKKVGDEAAKAEQKVDKLGRRVEKIKPPAVPPPVQLKATNQALKQTAIAGESAFGTAAIMRIGNFAAGFVSVSAAVGFARSSIQQLKADTDAAVASVEKLSQANRSLAQVATSPADYARLTTGSDKLAARYGVERDVARDVIFSARSEGFEGSVEDILRGAPAVDPRSSARVAGQLPTLFKDANLSPTAAINMTLKAAQQSRLNFEQIASAAPGAAEGTALTGSSPEETLAMLSVLAGKFKSGDTAADRIKAFSSKVGISKDKRLKGKSVLEALRTVQNDFSAKDRGEFLGEGVEINTAFRYLMENDSLITSR
jgi:hypothetical protein